MSQAQIYNRVWGWRKTCQPMLSVTANVRITSPITVADSIFGGGAYSVQLNARTVADASSPKGRSIQNILLVKGLNDLVWETEVSDPQGAISLGGLTTKTGQTSIYESIPNQVPGVLPVRPAMDPYRWGGVRLGLICEEQAGKITAQIALTNQNDNVVLQVPKTMSSFYFGRISNVNLSIVGMGVGSQAMFSTGGFDATLSVLGITDLTHDGVIMSQAHSPGDQCGLPLAGTDETSNLLYVTKGLPNQLSLTVRRP